MAGKTRKIPEGMKQVAGSIQRMLDEQGIAVHTVRPGRYGVDVITVDAHPEVQQAIQEICGMHQRGHPHIQSDGYLYDNIRKDVPQCDYVHADHRMTQELAERLDEFSRRNHPDQQQEVSLNLHLMSGALPGFWTSETGETQSPRCCACKRPVRNPDGAHQNHPGRTHRLYRHQQCGNFHPGCNGDCPDCRAEKPPG